MKISSNPLQMKPKRNVMQSIHEKQVEYFIEKSKPVYFAQ